MLLTSGLQLCLAHYCDVHGPTPLMVTEGLPVPCSMCYDHGMPGFNTASDRPHTSSQASGGVSSNASAAIEKALRTLNLGVSRSSSVPASELDAQTQRAAFLRASHATSSPGSAVETPPVSPRYAPEAQQRPLDLARRESNYRRTYDEHTTKRAGPCENCALTLPRRQESGSGRGAGVESTPTLRTRAPYAKVFGGGIPGDASPPTSTDTDTDGDDQPRRTLHRRTGTITSTTSRSSSSSSQLSTHTHYLDYTSTHEPVIPSSFSIVRASCLRTLSFETLPRHATTPGTTSPTSTPIMSPQNSPFVTTHSAGAAASGGPIFFGDPVAGYTTAYIFRIPDVHARGHKRVYAFLALSTHRERLAMKAFTFISNAFRDMATWIQALAEAEAERALGDASATSSPITANPGSGYGGLGLAQPQSQPTESSGGSSFLTGGVGGLSRRLGGGYGGGGVSLKARGLAELVGLPDFFIELHSRFVRLLLELGVVLGS